MGGSQLTEYQRLTFDIHNPHRVDVVVRTLSDAGDGFKPCTHEHPGVPESASGPVVIADPTSNDGGPHATVFGDAALKTGRLAWEVEVLTDGAFALGVAAVEGTEHESADTWPCCLDARQRRDKGGPFLFPGKQHLSESAALCWSKCESLAGSRTGVAARWSKPESLLGSRIGVFVDMHAAPPKVSFTLQGEILSSVEAPGLLTATSPIFPALQLEWDDLCALHVIPIEGSLFRDQLLQIDMYLTNLDAEALWPTTGHMVAAHAATKLTEEELVEGGSTAAYATFGENGDDHLPTRAEGESLQSFAARVIKLILAVP